MEYNNIVYATLFIIIYIIIYLIHLYSKYKEYFYIIKHIIFTLYYFN